MANHDYEASNETISNDPIKFAYWVPNVSGGLVVSKIEQRTDWGYDYNRKLAVLAENNGFDYALSQVRYMASYGAEYQHESTSFSLALLLATRCAAFGPKTIFRWPVIFTAFAISA